MLTDLIPQIGGFLGGSFLVLLGPDRRGANRVRIAAAAFVLYMNFENHVSGRPSSARPSNLTSPTTMVAALVGGAVAGVPGASSPRRSSARPRRSTWRRGAWSRSEPEASGQRPVASPARSPEGLSAPAYIACVTWSALSGPIQMT